MSLAVRKFVIVVFAITIILLANAWAIASWLDNIGLIAWASNIRAEFLTGTAIAVILAFLVLLSSSSRRGILSLAIRRCGVCDHLMLRRGRYCPMCGSRD